VPDPTEGWPEYRIAIFLPTENCAVNTLIATWKKIRRSEESSPEQTRKENKWKMFRAVPDPAREFKMRKLKRRRRNSGPMTSD
jgi:hypothetical protein